MSDTLQLRRGIAPIPLSRVTADLDTVEGDGTRAHPLHTNPDGVPVATDGSTVVGRGTKASPLHTNPDGVSVVTDGSTVVGRGTKASPLHTNPDGVSVATDGSTVVGHGTKVDPLRAVIPKPPVVPSMLPMTIHGSAFQASDPGQIAAPGVSLGLTGLAIPSHSGTVLLMTDVELPAGTHVTSVTVRVIDGLSTQVEAHFGSEDAALLKVSELSPGDGGEHDLVIAVDATIEAGKAYFIDAINPNGNAGWSILHATIA